MLSTMKTAPQNALSRAQLALLMPEMGAAVGGIVRKVWCRDALSFVLEIRNQGRNHFVLVSLTPGGVLACLVERKPAQPPAPPSFIMRLRKLLHGGRVLSLGQLNDDRVLWMGFEVYRPIDDDGDEPEGDDALFGDEDDAQKPAYAAHRIALVAELMPHHGNIFLLDAKDAVLGTTVAMNPKRGLAFSQPYQPPPQPPQGSPKRSETRRDPLGLESLPADGARSAHVAAYFEHAVALHAVLGTARDLVGRLRKAAKASARRLKAVEADMERVDGAEQWKRNGELLQSAYGRPIERGATSIGVPDFYAEGMPTVQVPLDPSMDLQGNIERYFKRYRKYNNAAEKILERFTEAEEHHEALLEAQTQANTAAWEATCGLVGAPKEPGQTPPTQAGQREPLEAMTRELEKRGLLRRASQRQIGGKRQQARKALPYRTFTSKTGQTILVGKGGKDNDALSLKIARGNDIWLHAQDLAGAHVVIRLAGRNAEPDQQTLIDAATLAAHYSKGRKDTIVDVMHTRAKYVRKPKGLPAGRVTVANARTLAVRIEEERLKRLFDERPDQM